MGRILNTTHINYAKFVCTYDLSHCEFLIICLAGDLAAERGITLRCTKKVNKPNNFTCKVVIATSNNVCKYVRVCKSMQVGLSVQRLHVTVFEITTPNLGFRTGS